MTVKFSDPEVERFVEQQVRSGAFASADAVLEQAVREMMSAQVEVLSVEDSEAIAEARAEVARGDVIPFETVVAEWRAKLGVR